MNNSIKTPCLLSVRNASKPAFLAIWMCIMFLFVVPMGQPVHAKIQNDDRFVAVTHTNLSIGVVHDMLQDEIGFMWFATDKGLFRYDGISLASVVELDPTATWLNRVMVHSLYSDSQGRIWAIFQGGIAFWDKEGHSFQQLDQVADKKSTVIIEQRRDKYWIGTEDGLYFFDASAPKDRSLERLVFVSDQQDRRNRNFITTLFLDENDMLWVGTPGGVCILDTRNRQFQEVIPAEAQFSNHYVSFIEQDATGGMWIGTRENGFLHVELKIGEERTFSSQFSHYSTLPSQQLLSVQRNKDNQFYVGTANNGFFLWDPLKKSLVDSSSVHVYPESETFVANARVLSLLLDQSDLLWLGTASGIYRSAFRPVFSDANALNEALRRFSIKHVKSLVRDANNRLWVGSFGEGVLRIDERTGEVIHYKNRPSEPNSLVDDRVLAIDIDKQFNVWMLTSGGISRFDLSKDTFSTYLESNNVSIVDENIIFQDIFVSESNEVWVTTSFYGVLKYNEEIDQFEPWPFRLQGYEDDALLEIRQILEGKDGSLWFAGGKGGVLRYDSENQVLRSFPAFPEENLGALKGAEVVSIAQTSNGELWVGTLQAGTFRIDTDTNSLVQYTRQDGLPGNEVTCILEDRKGFVWIAVRGGVARYDPELDTIVQYDEHDGLSSTQFYYNSCLLAENRLYLGNNLGIERLDLDKGQVPERRPVVQLASLQVLNNVFPFYDPNLPIQLEKDNNFVRFQFFLADYLTPTENKLRYKLTGVNEQWKTAGMDKTISFSDLDPGTYQLFVKGTNHRGIWSEPNIYTIEVSSIRWLFLGGVGLTGLLFVFAIGFALTFRGKYIDRIKELEEENLALQDESKQSVDRTKSEIARDLHDDLGADLSRLVLSLENRLQREDLSDFSLAWTQECWEYAQRVTREVRFLSWSVDPERNWLPDLVDRLYREVHDTFETDSIQFLTSKIPQIHLAPKVRKDIFLIFREALTNILTHASAKKIRIQVNYKKRMLEIIVEDDGIGFDIEKIVEGNGLSNMRKRARNLNANLFWDSKRGNGTRVVFQFLVE